MKAYIHCIQTMVPPHGAAQAEIARRLGELSGDPVAARLIRHVFQKSGIQRRHSVVPDLLQLEQAELYRLDEHGVLREPSTQERNRCFIKYALPMCAQLGRQLLNGSGFAPEEVTHVITVSCTGFANPGPDFQVVTELGLRPSVERYNLGFMGCYAALPALRMARQFCQANPEAVVLVICVELCSLHLQMQSTPDVILGNALFSDGAAAALVSARGPAADQPALALEHFSSALATEGVGEMAWEIGDNGFNLALSSYVPDVIGMSLDRVVDGLLNSGELGISDIPLWAIHPGGRAILDKVEAALGLEPWQSEASRIVLRDFGNMSSATILFVLARIMAGENLESSNVAALAFGPGLTIESALLTRVPATRVAVAREGEPAPATA